MNKKFRGIVNVMFGRNSGSDWDSFRIALADSIIGNLKDIDFFMKSNKLVVGCEHYHYQDAIEFAKEDIIKKLKNQGGTMRRLAQKIEKPDGFEVKIQPAPEGKEVKTIPADILPIDVWFYLEHEKKEEPILVISGDKWIQELEPSKRYTIGRGASSDNKTVMLTIPEAGKDISRKQAEFLFRDGQWYCKSISNTCLTYIDDRIAKGDELVPLENMKDGGYIRFGNGRTWYTLEYCTNNA